jgi:hypothetical protein
MVEGTRTGPLCRCLDHALEPTGRQPPTSAHDSPQCRGIAEQTVALEQGMNPSVSVGRRADPRKPAGCRVHLRPPHQTPAPDCRRSYHPLRSLPRARHATVTEHPAVLPLTVHPLGSCESLAREGVFFTTSTSKAFRPSARSSSSTRFCNPSTWLFGISSPSFGS